MWHCIKISSASQATMVNRLLHSAWTFVYVVLYRYRNCAFDVKRAVFEEESEKSV